MPISRGGGGWGPPAAAGGTAPTVLGSALVADNELSGVNSRTLTMTGITSAGTLLSWVGILTASFAGPVVGNNGNTYTQYFSQDFGADTPDNFTAYTLRGYRAYTASGGSAHTFNVTKSSGDSGELTLAGLLLSGGTIASSSVVLRDRAGAGATHTSGSVTATAPALLVAVCSGRGDVNATAPTQTWPGGWTIHQSVARNSSAAPNGHVPLYVATKEVAAGTYTVDVQVAINEGVLLSLAAVQ